MCGGGGGGGGQSQPKANPAAAVAVAPTPASAPTPQTAGEGTSSAAQQRGSRRADARKNMRVDVSVANVGGNGATGLNIPQPRG